MIGAPGAVRPSAMSAGVSEETCAKKTHAGSLKLPPRGKAAYQAVAQGVDERVVGDHAAPAHWPGG